MMARPYAPALSENLFGDAPGGPMAAAKLTVLIPCKDERRNIRPCIESVRGLADELLIADSGSTDDTLDIVHQVGGCRIIEREYINSANFKNWAIPQARYEWVLLVDADERITPELASEIRQVLESPPADKDGFWIARVGHYLGYRINHCGWDRDDVIRLFRRDRCRYQDRWVHAEVDLPAGRVGKLKHPMMHYTMWDSDKYLYKLNRYAGWGALNMRDAGRRPSLFAMLTRAPLRFLQLYFFRLGFLDGVPGFQICVHTAYYAFLKQAKLWELHHALPQPDVEDASAAASSNDEPRQEVLSFENPAHYVNNSSASQKRRAA
jgi:glycosyltransferase involved in cell wall biosynthesis